MYVSCVTSSERFHVSVIYSGTLPFFISSNLILLTNMQLIIKPEPNPSLTSIQAVVLCANLCSSPLPSAVFTQYEEHLSLLD